MKLFSLVPTALLTLTLAVAPQPTASAQSLTTVRVASGLSSPLYVTHSPNDTSRIFIVEQGSSGTARIKILRFSDGVVLPTPFLTISGILTGGERGLLGLAFHPDYETNGYFYVNYTTSGGGAAGQTVVSRWQVSADPNVADAGSQQIVLRIPQPFANHNGGWIGFGPDGYLYVATGDGGSGGDPGDRAQTITNQLLGKMLRLDVNGDDFPADPDRNYAIPADNPFVGVTGDDEIWAYGLRNPWRNAFDRATGDLYIADVGQNVWEEVNVQPGNSTGGENYGWRCYEGNASFNQTGCTGDPNDYVFPVHVYSHSFGCSISGGYVYRGCAMPYLRGTYFFADWCSENIWSFRYLGTPNPPVTNRTAELDPAGALSIDSIVSFGEDVFGEMYILDQGGEVYKIVPRCEGDLDGDGETGFDDLLIVLNAYGVNDSADLTCDGVTGFDDLLVVLNAYGCP